MHRRRLCAVCPWRALAGGVWLSTMRPPYLLWVVRWLHLAPTRRLGSQAPLWHSGGSAGPASPRAQPVAVLGPVGSQLRSGLAQLVSLLAVLDPVAGSRCVSVAYWVPPCELAPPVDLITDVIGSPGSVWQFTAAVRSLLGSLQPLDIRCMSLSRLDPARSTQFGASGSCLLVLAAGSGAHPIGSTFALQEFVMLSREHAPLAPHSLFRIL